MPTTCRTCGHQATFALTDRCPNCGAMDKYETWWTIAGESLATKDTEPPPMPEEKTTPATTLMPVETLLGILKQHGKKVVLKCAQHTAHNDIELVIPMNLWNRMHTIDLSQVTAPSKAEEQPSDPCVKHPSDCLCGTCAEAHADAVMKRSVCPICDKNHGR